MLYKTATNCSVCHAVAIRVVRGRWAKAPFGGCLDRTCRYHGGAMASRQIARDVLLLFLWCSFVTPLWAQDSLVCSSFDCRVLAALQQRRTPTGDVVMRAVSNSLLVAPAVPAGLAVGGWAAGNDRLLAAGAQTAGSLLLTGGVTMGLKALVARPRPYVRYAGLLNPVTTEMSYSFPSGHTSMAFSTATSLALQYPHWYVLVPSYLWAGTVAYSRMYLGVHYPSDVLTGALIGAACAWFTYQLQQRYLEDNNLPRPKGFMIPVSISF